MKSKRIKIAIQKKGRLNKPSNEFLASLGLNFPADDKKLTLACKNAPINLVKVRDDDIPKYGGGGAVDFGIVGLDVVEESQEKVTVVKRLGFAKCKMVIAIPRSSKLKTIGALEGKKIATSYPNILRAFLKKNKIRSTIVVVQGSVELAPYLKTADAVCDITQTGKTLREFDLIPIRTILRSEAILIGNPIKKGVKYNFTKKIS